MSPNSTRQSKYKVMTIRQNIVITVLIGAASIPVMPVSAESRPSALSDPSVRWNSAALQGIRDAKLGAPVVARALAIVHTCMYDA